MGPVLSAWRFDGRTAEARAVSVRIEGDHLSVESQEDGTIDRARLHDVTISEPLEHAPGLVALPGGIHLQVADRATLAERLGPYSSPPSIALRMQQRTAPVAAALVGIAALACLAYFYALPEASEWVALTVPDELQERIGVELLDALDAGFFGPSELADREKEEIRELFSSFARDVAPEVDYRIEFRSYAPDADAVNAFAVPGGIIIALDGLVEAVGSPNELVAVLAHELGHVHHRHVLRQVFQGLGTGALAGLMWGDFSSTTSGFAAAVGVMTYSRDFEREADAFALDFLEASELDPSAFGAFLLRVERIAEEEGHSRNLDFLSSHPSNDSRLATVRARAERTFD